MAEYLSSPSCVRLHLQRIHVNERAYLPPNSHYRAALRCYRHGRLSMCKFSNYGVETLKVRRHFNDISLRCSFLGFPDVATASDWVPVGDQLLLMASIFLTYLAGVIPVQKSNATSRSNILDQNAFPESSTTPGRARKDDEKADANLQCVWDVVKEKLLDSLDTTENGSGSGNRILEIEQHQARCPLSLFAVSEGPKLRLLWASFQQLQKEAGTVYIFSLHYTSYA